MKLLVAIDGSAGALAALRFAMDLAAAGLPCSFVLVNVQEPASLYEVMTAHDAERIDAVRSAAGADLLRPAEALLEAAGDLALEAVAGGAPENLIPELAENYGCDLILLGARGAGHPEAGGLGKVALAVLTTATVPVTIVRQLAQDDGNSDAGDDGGRSNEEGV